MQPFTLWVEQRVLLSIVRGGWSELTAHDYCAMFKTTAKPLLQSGEPWAHLVYLDDWGLGCPEIEPIIRGLAGWAVGNGLSYFAQVYSPNMVKQYQLDRMLVSDLGTCEKRTYAVEADAFNWLAEMGFETDSAAPMVKRA